MHRMPMRSERVTLHPRSKQHDKLAKNNGHKSIEIAEEDESVVIKLQAMARGRSERQKYQRKVGDEIHRMGG
jgi:hypothetical protein